MMENYPASIVLVVALSYFDGSGACSCLPVHLQNSFCQENSFVIKASVLNSVVIPNDLAPGNGERIITVQVLQDFRKNVPEGQIILNTQEADAMCGVALTDGQCYVLGGQIIPGNPDSYTINLCNFIMSCDQLTNFQNNALQKGWYERACRGGCEVHFDLTLGQPESATSCIFDFNNLDCFQQYGICAASSKRKTCSWEFDPDHTCLNL